MKRNSVIIAVLFLSAFVSTEKGYAEVNINLNVGVQAAVPLEIYLEEPPEFIYPRELGFYVAVGVPYDIYLVGSRYYLYQDGYWYQGSYYNGPWRQVERRHLPPGLRKHKHNRIRHYRDVEYRRYDRNREHYKGRYFQPETVVRTERYKVQDSDDDFRDVNRHKGSGPDKSYRSYGQGDNSGHKGRERHYGESEGRGNTPDDRGPSGYGTEKRYNDFKHGEGRDNTSNDGGAAGYSNDKKHNGIKHGVHKD